ncbi:MAG: Nif3-like dinuclear metal center hexameric protein [Candidatus Hadarchaeota archaeon]
MIKLKELHSFSVQEGIKKDPRKKDQIEDLLDERKKNFEELEGPKKDAYDQGRLENPFDDSKVIHGGKSDVHKLAVGIDIEIQDLLLIEKLNENGEEIDGVIAHHPVGRALARLHEVMGLQVDVLSKEGIPVSQAEGIVKPRSEEIKKAIHPRNHSRVPRAAELLDQPLVTLHTVTDNHAYSFMDGYIKEKEPRTLQDVIDVMLEIPEYKWALQYDMGPQVHSGNKENRAGKIGVFGFTGGTDLGENLIEKMVNSGVDTLIAMHATKKQLKKADEENINVITAGHMASDDLGINLLLDKIEKKFGIKFVELSGFKRVKR